MQRAARPPQPPRPAARAENGNENAAGAGRNVFFTPLHIQFFKVLRNVITLRSVVVFTPLQFLVSLSSILFILIVFSPLSLFIFILSGGFLELHIFPLVFVMYIKFFNYKIVKNIYN